MEEPGSSALEAASRTSPDDIIDPRHEKRNYWLTVINGVMTGGPSTLFDPNTVVAAFIIHLSGSQALVGLVSGIVMLGHVWPQLFVANWIEPKPKKLFVYHISTVLRLASLTALAVLIWVLRDGLPGWFVYAMIGLLFAFWSAGGFSAVAWYDILSKTVYSYKRPVLFAWRQTGAGIIALLAGGVITWALSPQSGMRFPLNYLFLLSLMTVLMAIGILCFNLVVEPAETHAIDKRRPFREYLRLGPQIMREDHNYRRLFWGQITFSLAVMPTPFLVPFLIKDLGVDDSVIGMLMIVAATADLLINVYWGQLGSRKGNRAVLVLGSRLSAYSPVLALGAVLMPKMAFLGIDVRILLVALALVMARIAGSGLGVGRMNYLLDVAPLGMRPSYMGFMNTFSAVSMIIPMTAGSAIQLAGYWPVFALAVVFGIVCIRVTTSLEDVKFTSHPNGYGSEES